MKYPVAVDVIVTNVGTFNAPRRIVEAMAEAPKRKDGRPDRRFYKSMFAQQLVDKFIAEKEAAA